VYDVAGKPERVHQILKLVTEKAIEGAQAGEAPIGAAVLDRLGEVIGAGHAGIVTHNDPSLVAAMAAWRACGARDHWKDKTLFLTAGPDHIAYSMFHIFRFGQLVIGSAGTFGGQLHAVRGLGVPVHVLHDPDCEELLHPWLAKAPLAHVREYLGADFTLSK
jgi:tRNA(Arg) A34 adenosine deaminase TadA